MRWGIDLPFKKIQTYDIKSLFQHFEKEIYQYVNISLQKGTPSSGCFLQENTCAGVCLFLILSIVKFLRAPILKNICERVLLETFSRNWVKLKFIHNFTLKNRFFHQYEKQMNMFVFISWLVSYEVCFATIFLWCGEK